MKDRIYIEDFIRFENGQVYSIEFDDRGAIKKATIYHEEMDEDIDVTPYIANSKYWQKKVYERLVEIDETSNERKYFKAYKDA